MDYLVLWAVAAGLTVLLTPLVRALAVRLHAMDEPGGRRIHARPVPRLGGLAVLAAGAATLGIGFVLHVRAVELLSERGWQLGWLLAGILVVASAGAVDDTRGLGPASKLVLEGVAAALALAGGSELRGMTNPFTGGYVEFGPLGNVLAVVWIVGITNAVNLIDGLDGLAAGVTFIAAVTLFVVSLSQGRPDAACLWAVLAGAVGGFLCYNFNPASIFLGDAGSLLLGYLLAVLSIQSLQKGATALVVLTTILALGFPLMEVIVTVVRRTLGSGLGSILRADSEHIHHRLLGRGVTHRRAVLTLYAVCAACGAFSFVAVVLAERAPAAILVGVTAAAIYAGVTRLRRRTPHGRAAERAGPSGGAAR